MKTKWNQKGRRYMATFLAILLVWSLIPGNSFAVSASTANTVSGNEATPSDAEEIIGDTELEEDELDEFADGDLVDDLASPSDAEKNDTYITGNDEEVDVVQDMIASLPSIKEYNQLTAEEQAEVLTQVKEAMDAYNDLTEEQQKGIVGEEIFTLYEEFLTATPSNATKEKAFEQSQTIDGITVRVTGDEGVFPKDAVLHVEKIEDVQTQEKIQSAIEETTGVKDDPQKTVANTVVFDITIQDNEGNELQPDTDKGEVKVTFEKVDTSNVEAGKSTLEAFHMNEDCTQAEKLDAEVDVNAGTVEMKAEHFSPYAVSDIMLMAEGDVASVTVNGGESVGYTTIYDALNYADQQTEATKVTLLQDCNLTQMIWIGSENTSADVTLELGECTLTYDSTCRIIVSGGTLTITSGATGKIIASNTQATVRNDGGTLHITGGEYTNSQGRAIQNTQGTLTISGGTFTSTKETTGSDEIYGLETSSGGTCTLTGGTFSGIYTDGVSFTSILGNGYTFYEGENTDGNVCNSLPGMGQYNKTVTVGKKYVASVTTSEGIKRYATLEEAVTAAAGKTATITLLADINTTAPVTIPVGSTITLDLNGCTIDRGKPELAWYVLGYVIFNQGTLTIQDNGKDETKPGTITGGNDESFAGGIQNDGTLTIEGGKITGNHIEDGSGGGGITNTGTLNITGGIITGNTIGTDGTLVGAGIACHRGTLTIEGGTIQDDIYIRGGTVALKGGSFSKIKVASSSYGKTVADLLGDASGYKIGGSWATADQLTAKSIESENLTVEEAPVKITTKPTADSTLDFGSTVKLEVVTDPTEGVSYQWADNGTDITGATEASYTTDKNMALGDHRFTCKLTLGDYTAITKAVPISYNYAEPAQNGGVYQIASASNLMWFAATVNGTDGFTQNQTANAVLTADIDMAGITWVSMNSYSGTLDGAGFTISNLTGQNLIRTLASGGTVKNITFDNANVAVYESLGNGVIAGTSYGTISGCVVTNSYLAYGQYNYCGGIAGRNEGTIQNCAVLNSKLERIQGGRGQKPIGGIADTNNGTVQNCYAYNVTLIDASVAGGICTNYDPDTNTVKGTAPTNSYYTTSNVSSTVDGIAKTTADFASGAVTWLLNGSYDGATFTPGATDGTQVWYQLLGESGDTYPVLVKADGNTVYKLVDGTYSNSNVVATADKIIGHSLTPNGTISVNFYMEFTAETIKNQSQYYVQVKDAKGTVHETTELSDLLRNQTPKIVTDTAGAHSCYKISGAVAAKEMADKLTVKLMKRNGEQETEIFKEDYAVSDYFALAKQSGKTELIALTNAMAIYGAYSQQYFQYNTDTLATDLSGVDVSGVTAEALKDYTYNLVQTENAPISYYGTSLLLEADTTLRHYFKLSEGTASLEGLIFKIGDTVASPVQSTKDTSLYYVEIENIRAKDLELSYTVVVGTADTNYITVTNYSPLTYVKKALESSNTKAGLQPAMQALYLYWKEADKYNYPN